MRACTEMHGICSIVLVNSFSSQEAIREDIYLALTIHYISLIIAFYEQFYFQTRGIGATPFVPCKMGPHCMMEIIQYNGKTACYLSFNRTFVMRFDVHQMSDILLQVLADI